MTCSTVDYSAIKKNELLIHKIRWMNLKIIMMSERSQAKNTYYNDSMCINSRNQSIVIESRSFVLLVGRGIMKDTGKFWVLMDMFTDLTGAFVKAHHTLNMFIVFKLYLSRKLFLKSI